MMVAIDRVPSKWFLMFNCNGIDTMQASLQKNQNGAVLFVSLILLLVITLMGITNIESSTLQLKMVKNTYARQVAFTAAERSLSDIERLIVTDKYLDKVQNCQVGSAGCFNQQCTGGLCFNGSYDLGDAPFDCELSQNNNQSHYWSSTVLNVWDETSKHQILASPQSDVKPPQYIVEFLCFASKSTIIECSPTGSIASCTPIFRVTTRVTTRDEKANVMLQSVFRYPS